MPITMTLTVPYRGAGLLQTATTQIELEAATIAADATVTVDSNVLNVPDSSCTGGSCMAVGLTTPGDGLQLERVSGTDRVRLFLTFNGSFADSNNLCGGLTALGSADRSFIIVLDGFTFDAAGGYRITSMMAPGAPFCEFAYVRVPTARPFITVAPPDTVNRLGRFPLSVALALDKSGSMNGMVPATSVPRWNRLQDSVQELAQVWGQLGAPGGDGSPEDRLGVLFFDSTATTSNLGGAGQFFVQRNTDTDPWTTPLDNEMNANSPPGGSTSLGAAIEAGRQELDAVDVYFGDTTIFLFTDGEQNTSPCVLHEGETTTFGCSVAASAGSGARLTLNGSGVYTGSPFLVSNVGPMGPIYTIGLGEGVAAESGQLLDEIAQETAGTGWIANNGPAMSTAFNESLLRILQGTTASSLGRIEGVLPGSAPTTPSLEVLADDSVSRVVFVLGWEELDSELDLAITDPGGTVVQAVETLRGRRSLVARIDLPASGPAGLWQVRAINGSQSFATAAPPAVIYRLVAYGVETRLSFRVTETPRVGTGAPLQIVAEVGWDGDGLPDLPAGAIRAFIQRPGENLGNILHDADTGVPDPGADQSALAAKIAELMENGKLLDRIAPRPAGEAVELQSVGHGRYEGTFNGVEVGGQYQIRVAFDWTDPRTGQIRREQWAERRAAVVPTPDDTSVEVGPISGRGTGLRITPMDGFGNRIVGYANRFRVIVAGKLVDQAVVDTQLRGIYELDLTAIVGGGDPQVEIVFDGTTLRKGPLSGLSKPGLGSDGSGTGWGTLFGVPWWVWLLLILALLLLWYLLG